MPKLTPIVTFNSNVPGAVPGAGTLLRGELAVNAADGFMWTSSNGIDIVPISDVTKGDGPLTYMGTIDCTVDPNPNGNAGDVWINTGDGLVDASWTGIAGEVIAQGNMVGLGPDGITWELLGVLGKIGVTSVTDGANANGITVDNTDPSNPRIDNFQRIEQHIDVDTTNRVQNSLLRWDDANSTYVHNNLVAIDAPVDANAVRVVYGRRDDDDDGLNTWERVRIDLLDDTLRNGNPDLAANPNSKWLAFNGATWEHSELELPTTIDFMGTIDAINNPPPAGGGTNEAYIHTPGDGTIDPGWALGATGIQVGDQVLQGDMLVFSTNTGFWYNAGTGANAVISVTGQTGVRAVGAADQPVLKMARVADGDAVDWHAEVNHLISEHGDVNTAGATLDDVLVFDGAEWVPEPKAIGFGHNLNFHTDVDTATDLPVAGDGLYWNGTTWVPQSSGTANPTPVPHALGTHTDVDLATVPPAAGNVLSYDGANWVPGAAGGAGEVNTSSNVGAGEGLALPKVGADLPFKTITAGPNITLVSSASELNIDATVPAPTVQLGADNGLATAPLNLSVVATLPGVPDANTIYFVTT